MKITAENIGNKIAYEANGIKDWRIIGIAKNFKENYGIFIISDDYVPTSCLDMKGYDIETIDEYKVRSAKKEELKNWMTDYKKWKAFASGVSGASAQGGPTICEIVDWWNAWCRELLGTWGYQQPFCVNSYSYGYKFYTKYGYDDKFLNDSYLFHVDGTEKCYGYWLASISAEYAYRAKYGEYMLTVYRNAIESNKCCSTVFGIRPVVYLPINYYEIELWRDYVTDAWMIN